MPLYFWNYKLMINKFRRAQLQTALYDYDDFVQRERSKLYPKTVINNQTAEQGHTNCIMLRFTEVTNGSKAT